MEQPDRIAELAPSAFALPAKIEDYALIGDCPTAALVSREGSIDRLGRPSFDSDACFAALLGTSDNGRWLIAPKDKPKAIRRASRKDTLILETTFECADGEVTLIDFMPLRGSASDIVRLVRWNSGVVVITMELVLRFSSGSNIPWVQRLDDGSLQAIAGPDMAVLRTPAEFRGENLTTVSEFSVKAGETVPFVLTYDHPDDVGDRREACPPAIHGTATNFVASSDCLTRGSGISSSNIHVLHPSPSPELGKGFLNSRIFTPAQPTHSVGALSRAASAASVSR